MATKQRLDYIDGLRGFACVWVLFHHAFEGIEQVPLPLRLFADIGGLGVSLFLVLSGFCLYYPLVSQQPMSALFTPWFDLPLHLLLLHNLTAKTFASVNSVSWSLALEWQLYLIFPLLVLGVSKLGLHKVLWISLRDCVET